MMPNPFTLAEIASWYRSKRRLLEGSTISLVEIRERLEYLPAAAADFDSVTATGRITGWVSGAFDFEVVRGSDGKDLFWGHVHADAVEDLEDTYVDFLKHLEIPAGHAA
jgi:hypothetical protein